MESSVGRAGGKRGGGLFLISPLISSGGVLRGAVGWPGPGPVREARVSRTAGRGQTSTPLGGGCVCWVCVWRESMM